MSLHRMFDASRPPKIPFPNCDAVAGYIGGNTPHVWTVDEWNLASRNGHLRMLPIWVGYGEEDPIGHAKEAVKAAVALGWRAHYHRYICNDMETDAHDHKWCQLFAAQLKKGGFDCLEYRSLSAITTDPTPSLIDNWVADWNVTPRFDVAPRTEAFQYRNDVPFERTAVDLSVITDFAFNNLGRGQRKTRVAS